MENLMTVKEVAVLLSVHPKKVQRMARAGELPCVRIGSVYRFAPAQLQRWFEKGVKSPDALSIR